MNVLLVCAWSLLLIAVHESSNPPTPSDGEPQCPQQGEATAECPEQYPSNPSRPGPAISESETEPTTDSVAFEVSKHKKQHQEPAAEEWHHWTLIFFTAVLAGATIALVLITKGLRNAASKQNQIMNKRHDLAEKEYRLNKTIFYTENQPRLQVRRLVIDGIERVDRAVVARQEHILFDEGGPRGFIELYNAGNSPGTPTQAYVQTVVTTNLREPLPQPWKEIQDKTIRVGGSYKIKFGPEKWPSQFEYASVINRAEASVYLIAAIRYKDRLDNEITTELCYRFNSQNAQFERVRQNQNED